MRVLVFFDLPVLTSENRRAYAKFRRFLLKNGFLMEIKGLFIENSEKTCVEGMERYIIDKDKCEIY